MSHEVESMVSVREVPWHQLGTIVEKQLTAKEALVFAGLDWAVELAPLVAVPTKMQQLEVDSEGEARTRLIPYTGEPLPIEGQFAVIRDSDLAVLGVVGSQYKPIQNHAAFEFFDALVDSGEAKYETAGSLKSGRVIFLTAKIPKEILIGGEDPVDLYLALASSHDGSLAFTSMVTPVRIVCQNTLNWGMSAAKQRWSIRHTESADGRIEEARKALGLTFAYADEFQAEAEALIAKEFTKAEFEKMVERLVPDKGATDDTSRQVRMALIGTLESSPTIDDSFRYTGWGALNAVAEYADWIRPYRASKSTTIAEQRTSGMWFGTNKKMKEDARKLLLDA